MTEMLPSPRQAIEALDDRKWDLLQELAALEMAKAALLAKIREGDRNERTIPSETLSD